jgi:hypothetical protein
MDLLVAVGVAPFVLGLETAFKFRYVRSLSMWHARVLSPGRGARTQEERKP